MSEPQFYAEIPQTTLPVREQGQWLSGRLDLMQNINDFRKDGEAGRTKKVPQFRRVIRGRTVWRTHVQTPEHAFGKLPHVTLFFMRGLIRRVIRRVPLKY